MPTLADAERETASRVGPFFAMTASAGTADAVVVNALRSSGPVGGYEGLYLLRREATQADDRVRTVERFDATGGSLIVDFPYTGPAAPGEPFELHHLHPDLQLLADVRAALRRCYLIDTLAVTPPAAAVAAVVGPTTAGAARTIVVEVPASDGHTGSAGTTGDGWQPVPPLLLRAPAVPPGVLSSRAGVTAPLLGGGPVAVVDLTAQAFWLTTTRQVLAIASDGVALPAAGRYGDPSAGGWTCAASRGHLYLGIPAGVPLDGITVRAYRDAFGLVDDLDDPAGPADDDAELAVPLDYVCAFAHAEAWRRHRDRLEASAAEGRFATQAEASAEATRCAALYADFLFRPQTERGDRPGSPWGNGAKTSQLGLGGSGALAGAVVNMNDPYA